MIDFLQALRAAGVTEFTVKFGSGPAAPQVVIGPDVVPPPAVVEPENPLSHLDADEIRRRQEQAAQEAYDAVLFAHTGVEP